MLGDVKKLFVLKSLLTMPTNVLPLQLKQTFPHTIWIFTEGEGDGIESSKKWIIYITKLIDVVEPFKGIFQYSLLACRKSTYVLLRDMKSIKKIQLFLIFLTLNLFFQWVNSVNSLFVLKIFTCIMINLRFDPVCLLCIDAIDCKVHIFWEGHKFLRNLHHLRFDRY